MVRHPSRRRTNVFKEHDHAITATALGTKYISTLRLLPMLPIVLLPLCSTWALVICWQRKAWSPLVYWH